MKNIDIKVEQVYNCINSYLDEHGFPPTVREIGAHIGVKSTSTVYYYLEKLKKDGKITQQDNKNRAITVPNAVKSKATILPLVGDISAGTGILAVENIEGYYPVPQDMFKGESLFMLKVKGESMINVGIDDGDYVIVNKQSVAEIGEIVVAFWNDVATVKTLVSVSPFVLHPENNFMQDISLSESDNPQILGKVVGCIKKF